MPSLREIAKRLTLLAVILAVSGAPGHVVQGVAWWQMAERSGGLPEAMFESSPCQICCLARELNDNGDPESPVPAERIQNFRLVATVTELLAAPSAGVEMLHRTFPRGRSELFPGNRKEQPDTPPPRSAA